MTILRPDLPKGVSTKTTQAGKSAKADSKKENASGPKATSARGDNVEISQVGHQMKSLESQLKVIPDVRMAKIDSMKAKIESGYNPPAVEVADAIIRTVRTFG